MKICVLGQSGAASFVLGVAVFWALYQRDRFLGHTRPFRARKLEDRSGCCKMSSYYIQYSTPKEDFKYICQEVFFLR